MRVVITFPNGTEGLNFDTVAVAVEHALDEIIDKHPGVFPGIDDLPVFEFKPLKKHDRKPGGSRPDAE